jgi:hypothetical protein
LALSQEVKVHCVYHSLGGDVDVYEQPIVGMRKLKGGRKLTDDSKIFGEAVPDKGAARINK